METGLESRQFFQRQSRASAWSCLEIIMKEPLNILHLEDDALDAALAKTHLCAEGVPCNITHTHERGEFNAALAQENWDVILSDFSMPRFDGLSALEIARARRPEVPFIFVSGTIGEEQAVRALKEGATDYVLKDRMSRLSEAVRRAVKEAHELVQRRDAEDRLRKCAVGFLHVLAHSPAVMFSLKVEGGNIFPIFVSENITRLLGFTVEECLTSDWWGRLHAEDSERLPPCLQTSWSTGPAPRFTASGTRTEAAVGCRMMPAWCAREKGRWSWWARGRMSQNASAPRCGTGPGLASGGQSGGGHGHPA